MTNIALTSLSTSLCPDWSIRSPMELPGECFHGTFCIDPSPCLHLCLFIFSSLQGSAHVLLSLPKTGSKMGLRIYGRPLEAKTAEIPMRKSDVLTLALLLNQGEKIRVSSRRKLRFYYVNKSLKTLCENTAAKRDPHRSQGGAMQKRRETWITQSNNCRDVKTTNSHFWLRNLSGCARVQVEPQASTNLTWKETYN